MSPGEALTFAVVRERGELRYKRVSGEIPRFGKHKFNNWSNKARPSNVNPETGFVEREPVNGVNNQVLDKCHKSGNLFKPNHGIIVRRKTSSVITVIVVDISQGSVKTFG